MNDQTFDSLVNAYKFKKNLCFCYFSINCTDNCHNLLNTNNNFQIKQNININETLMFNYANILTFCIRYKNTFRRVGNIITNIKGLWF